MIIVENWQAKPRAVLNMTYSNDISDSSFGNSNLIVSSCVLYAQSSWEKWTRLRFQFRMHRIWIANFAWPVFCRFLFAGCIFMSGKEISAVKLALLFAVYHFILLNSVVCSIYDNSHLILSAPIFSDNCLYFYVTRKDTTCYKLTE